MVGEYLGWVEILRQEVFFLELGDELENRDWNTRLDAVRRAFLADRYPGAMLRLFNGQQRAIGELMAVPIGGGEGRLICMDTRRSWSGSLSPASVGGSIR